MSELLQRLVVQARGTHAVQDPSRVRPAGAVQAQAPLGVPAEVDRAPIGPLEFPRAALSRLSGADATPSTARRGTTHGSAAGPEPAASPELDVLRVHARRDDLVEPARAPARDIADRAPPALLGEAPAEIVASTAIIPLTMPRVVSVAAPAQAAGETTEVHVHIGRIELIAPPGSGKPDKKPRAAPSRTLPLGEYLARRRSP